jgi:hypothetical protein
MIAAFIFLLLLLSLGSMYLKRPLLTILLFMISLVLIMLLFIHHATDALDISL